MVEKSETISIAKLVIKRKCDKFYGNISVLLRYLRVSFYALKCNYNGDRGLKSIPIVRKLLISMLIFTWNVVLVAMLFKPLEVILTAERWILECLAPSDVSHFAIPIEVPKAHGGVSAPARA